PGGVQAGAGLWNQPGADLVPRRRGHREAGDRSPRRASAVATEGRTRRRREGARRVARKQRHGGGDGVREADVWGLAVAPDRCGSGEAETEWDRRGSAVVAQSGDGAGARSPAERGG